MNSRATCEMHHLQTDILSSVELASHKFREQTLTVHEFQSYTMQHGFLSHVCLPASPFYRRYGQPRLSPWRRFKLRLYPTTCVQAARCDVLFVYFVRPFALLFLRSSATRGASISVESFCSSHRNLTKKHYLRCRFDLHARPQNFTTLQTVGKRCAWTRRFSRI